MQIPDRSDRLGFRILMRTLGIWQLLPRDRTDY
jgi:hypothetical protein